MELIAPIIFNPSAQNYARLAAEIDSKVRSQAMEYMKVILEKMDQTFRFSVNRTSRYYISNTRSSTIVTLFGELTYKRTEYRQKDTRKSFIYVDEKIGLLRRMRYDACICSLVYELYSDQNSMIKVGKLIGDRISPFMLDENHPKYQLSRQLVQKILLRFKKILPPIKRLKTPEEIFIMADEKYIPLQEESRNERDEKGNTGISGVTHRHAKAMTKLAVSFTGRKQVSTKRWQLTNRHFYSCPDDSIDFWTSVHDDLARRYDMEKIKRIYIMGDGAPWIKAGIDVLQTQYTRAKYAADRYHIHQAIHRMSKDDTTRKILISYAESGSKKEFRKMSEKLKANGIRNEKYYDDQINYVLNQMDGLMVMNKEVKIGCSMEQAIQHAYASCFTSVPKAYNRMNLRTYVTARTAYQNNINMRKTFINALDKFRQTKSNNIDFRDADLDFSIFNHTSGSHDYHLNLKDNR